MRRECMGRLYGVAESKKSPEDWLLARDNEKTRGRLKVFLGYAPGVGKTFSMLSEGIRRRSRGEDVVIGIVETHGRSGTAELAAKLEQVPRREIEYKGTLFYEMDVDAILARMPQVALVDELAHTNIEGSRFAKRYEDVLLLLEHKIDVLSTLNIQHVESLAPRVQALTGISVREQVPDWVLDRADEIVISDLTPEALVTRMRRGDIYPPERVERSLANFFRRGNLIALREMALQRVTRAVDRNLDDYVRRKKLGAHWTVSEKVAVCISSSPQARDLIARGARLAEALEAELYVLHVASDRDAGAGAQAHPGSSLQFARNLGCAHRSPYRERHGPRNRDRIFVTTASHRRSSGVPLSRAAELLLLSSRIQKFMSEAPHVDLHIVTQEKHS